MTSAPLPEPPPTPAAADDGWERTDPRMIALTLIGRLGSLVLPVGFLVLRLESERESVWSIAVAVLGLVLALGSAYASWRSTRYRVGAERFEVRRGVLHRTHVSARVDRVRSVELEAPLLHRVFGLVRVTVKTGTEAEPVVLDSLRRAPAEELRAQVLRLGRRATADAERPVEAAGALVGEPEPDDEATAHGGAPTAGAPSPEEHTLVRLRPGWVRFAVARAPVGAFGIVVAVAGFGFFVRDAPRVQRFLDWLPQAPLRELALGVAALLVVGALMSTWGWINRWWGGTLTHDGAALHLRRGLLTTTSSTFELARIRGVQIDEPALVRPLRGARFTAFTTGGGLLDGGSEDLLPLAPRDVVADVGRAVLAAAGGTPVDPVGVPTQGHGPRARRRLWIGALGDTAFLLGVLWLVSRWLDWQVPWATMAPLLLLGALVLAELEHRTRGWALVPGHLVATSGRIRRRRVVLQTPGIIGWTLTQSLLQRRAGLANLTATTAAGPESVELSDVPLADALRVMAEATPHVWAGATSEPSRELVRRS